MSATRYLVICIGLPFFVLAAIASINYVADPIGIYHYDKPWDWTQHRSGIAIFLDMHKTYEVQNYKPDALILGNSRALHSLDPGHPALPPRTYNFGVSAANIYVCWRNLQQAADAHMPKLVILAIDENMFNVLSAPSVEFSEARFSVRADGQRNYFYRWSDVGATLLSIKALTLSLKNLAAHGGPDFPYHQGFQADGMLKEDHMNLTSRVYAANRAWLVPYRSDFHDRSGAAPQMDAFGNILSFCAKNKIRLIVLINPLHSSLIDTCTDDWNKYSEWMKATVQKWESIPNPQSEFWDFTSYNNMSTEKFPEPTEKYSHMVYYWEGAHYRINVGDMVLSRILAGEGPDNFGHRVDSENVQEDLDRIKAEKDAWHQHGQVVVIKAEDTSPKANHAAQATLDGRDATTSH